MKKRTILLLGLVAVFFVVHQEHRKNNNEEVEKCEYDEIHQKIIHLRNKAKELQHKVDNYSKNLNI
ncbi:hypothetical protein [Serpentinicella alkaliphila]|uniref:Uncharacterized protein n=1 Tax=Serpentinicella alkaliphila TaxID=1734049 RepID=A0A4R2SXP2_9FIRM|nr:hypothetical protein [Serpentinicella alkaliphila]QUH25854.1 hypothetical protein HZR23_08970 [Serpentinicella alkaliphila]TCP95299.1 hypothetical protein EDD79_10615 [Serpentinicella alkaliphila]